ncbi:MAG: AAA family ATPase, partial [Clostridia bacterium]|nr:AAA family ATPase [Clostridia bacterium]
MMMNIQIENVLFSKQNWCSCLASSGSDEIIKVVGNITDPQEKEQYTIRGEYNVHPVYGKQFVVKESTLNDGQKIDEDTIRNKINDLSLQSQKVAYLLLNGFVQNVGPKTTEKIVDHLGNRLYHTVKELDNSALSFLNNKLQSTFFANFIDAEEYMELNYIFKGYLSPLRIKQIVHYYKEKKTAVPIEKIQQNPFRLIAIIDGLGYTSLNNIVKKLNLPNYEEIYVKAAIVEAMREINRQGDCYCTEKELMYKLQILIGKEVDVEKFESDLLELIQEDHLLVVEDDNIFLKTIYDNERFVADFLNKHNSECETIHPSCANSIIDNIENEDGILFDAIQRQAVHTANQNRISIITGGPGTGKSTIVKAITRVWLESDSNHNDYNSIKLLAPTGKAAKRIRQTTGLQSNTIHKEIAMHLYTKKTSDIPILYIVDEASMMDINLMAKFCNYVQDDCKIVFVGDKDQLPSIGPGNVLADMLDKIPTTYLSVQHRSSGSIVWNAKLINEGANISDFIFDDSMQFISAEQDKINNIVISEYKKAINQYGVTNVSILTPRRKKSENQYQATADTLNELISPQIGDVKTKKNGFCVRDRVIQSTNDYTLSVFNGDTGSVAKITNEGIDVMMDDGRMVEYDNSKIIELNLAYATTIHKSQGSEYDVVIFPMTTSDYIMLQRNLLYTAVTRGKQKVILIGNKKALSIAVRTNKVINRNTMLKKLLSI